MSDDYFEKTAKELEMPVSEVRKQHRQLIYDYRFKLVKEGKWDLAGTSDAHIAKLLVETESL
jgi:hypothetical protein